MHTIYKTWIISLAIYLIYLSWIYLMSIESLANQTSHLSRSRNKGPQKIKNMNLIFFYLNFSTFGVWLRTSGFKGLNIRFLWRNFCSLNFTNLSDTNFYLHLLNFHQISCKFWFPHLDSFDLVYTHKSFVKG